MNFGFLCYHINTMAERLKNIIEDIAADFLKSALALRYDICTCGQCQTDMLAYVLSRVPAKYTTTDIGALHTLMEQTRIEHQGAIARAVISAIEIISKNPRHELKEDKQRAFEVLLNKIFEERGLDFRHYRRELLKRRVALRMRANQVNSYSEYLHVLIKKPEEYDRLFETMCINVSEFFRDPEIWITVKYLFEDLIRRKNKENDTHLRIWSAGCANGEEAYSAAILLKDMLKYDISRYSVEIIGSDIDKKCINETGFARYPRESLRNVDESTLKRYFTSLLGGSYRLNKEIKDMVSFRYLDLIGQDYIENADVIFCRNVFIYFSRSLQEYLLTKFYKSLKTGGYLVMGRVETILREAKEIFEEVDFNARIYRKK